MLRLIYSSSVLATHALCVNRIVSASEVLSRLTGSFDQSTCEVSVSVISNTTPGGAGWTLVETCMD